MHSMRLPIGTAKSVRPAARHARPWWRPQMDRQFSRYLLLALQICILAVACLSSAHAPQVMSEPFLKFQLGLAAAILIMQFLYRATGQRPVNWLSIDLLTMIAFVLVHYTYSVYYLLDDLPWDRDLRVSTFGGDATNRVCYTMSLCTAALAGFAIGYNILPEHHARPRASGPDEWVLSRGWQVLGTRAIICASVAGMVILALLGPGALQGSYGGSESDNPIINILLRLTMMLEIAGVAVLGVSSWRISPRIQAIGLIPMTLVFIVVMAFAIHGDRNFLFSIVVILGIAYSENARPMTLRLLAVGFMVGMALFVGIGVSRVSETRSLSSMIKTFQQRRDEVRWDQALVEIGFQAQPLFAATKWVPEHHDLYYGKLMALETIGIIPFSSHLPIVQYLWGTNEYKETKSSRLLTWIIVGHFDSGGKSTTSVADVYLNFGFYGAIVALAIQGLLCKYVQQRSRGSGSVLWGCAYCMLIPIMAHSQRGSVLSTLVEELFWPVIVVVVFASLLGLGQLAVRRRPRLAGTPLQPWRMPPMGRGAR